MSGGVLSQTFALSLGKLLASLSALATTSLLTHMLSVDEYAHYRVAMLLLNLIAPALILGVPQALFVALAGESPVRQRRAFYEGLSLLGLMSGLLALLFLTLFDLMTGGGGDPELLALSLPLALLALSATPKHALPPPLITLGRVKLLATYQVLSQLLSSCLICLGAWLWSSAEATLWLSAVGAGVTLLAGLRLVHGALPKARGRPDDLAERGDAPQVAWAGVWSLLCLGIPVGLARMFGMLSQQLDKYIVSQRFDAETFAVYVTGAMEVPVIAIVTGALSSVLLPRLSAHFKRGERHEMGRLWREMMERSSLVLLPVMWGVLSLGDELLMCLFSSAYWGASVPFKIYALLLPLKCAVYGSVLIASGLSRWVTLSSLMSLTLNVLLSLLLIDWIGVNGPAWATVLTAYLSTAILFIPLCRLFQVSVKGLARWGALVKVALVSASPLAVTIPLEVSVTAGWSPLWRLLTLGALYVGLTLMSYLRLGLIQHPRELIPRRST